MTGGGGTLPQRVSEALITRCGVTNGDRVLVACSGGADSMALLDLLAAAREPLCLRLAAHTVDHGVRADGAEDAAAVRALGRRLGVPVSSGAVDIDDEQRRRQGLEAAARAARHAALEAAADRLGADHIALAHHRDDQAETVLMRALTGTGVGGLAAMRWRAGRRIRPLLGEPRAALRSWLTERGIAWRDDPTNAELGPLRNRIRHALMPVIEETVGPHAPRALAALAQRCAGDERLLAGWAAEALDAARADGGVLSAAAVAALDPALAARVVRLAIARARPSAAPSAGHVAACVTLCAGPDRDAGADLPGGVRWERRGGVVEAVCRPPEPSGGDEPQDLEIGGSTDWPAARLTVRAAVHADAASVGRGEGAGSRRAWFDLDQLTTPLHMHRFAAGARIRPFGGPGSRKISDLLGEAAIPRRLRRGWPVVSDGDGPIWLPGVRAADTARVGPKTRRILELSLVDRP